MQNDTNIFWSGHSLTDPPIPEMLAEISAGFGVPMHWNRHSMAGASMEARTRGRPANPNGWDGYRQGNNRDTVGMDVIKELQTAATVGGKNYNALIITEVHDFLWSLLNGDTVRLLRHYHEQFIDANPAGQTFFYQSWLALPDSQEPETWLAYERAAAPVWQCIATRINTSLTAEGRGDRLRFLPASLALVSLVEHATTEPGIKGITADTVPATLKQIFKDGVHLTDSGAYFIALVSYAFVTDKPPADAWAPTDMGHAESQALQQLAWDFYTKYQSNNAPLTLAECGQQIHSRFAKQYWDYIYAQKRYDDTPWYAKSWEHAMNVARQWRARRASEQGFTADNPDNPFRFEPDQDANYWHSAP